MNMKKLCSALAGGLMAGLLFAAVLAPVPKAQAADQEVVIDVTDYGAKKDSTEDSAEAIWEAFEAAKEAKKNGASSVTVTFPKGTYHIYKDRAEKREYHTSNTSSTSPAYYTKTIGLLIEGQEDFTLEGNNSLFMMHGNMMALAVVDSKNVKLQNFSWDFGVPTISEMTVTDMGETEDGKPYTDFLIPECFPHEIVGGTMKWYSEKSPYTNEYYWTRTGNHENSYGIVTYQPDGEMSRNNYVSDGPFNNVSSLEEIDDTHVRIVYNSQRPVMQKMGTVIELASNAIRETAGAFIWQSENVTSDHVNVHYMHGFGWLVQMSKDVYYYNCNLMPREGSGHITVSFADGIHAAGAAGELVIENCNFANTHDDPINLHGTFMRVESRNEDGHTLTLKYIHAQQGGFSQFFEGDQVAFFTRDTLESTDEETLYTVEEVVSAPGENGNDLKTMVVRFKEELPANLSDTVSGQPKYVAENVTYTPEVVIRNCTFRQVPTRGILCTTRKKVLIEGNTFKNMSMATIFLSNDSDEWYESGPIRDMTIRNNEFYISSIGRTWWDYAPPIYIHPVTKGGGLPSEDNPIHKNITIEGNSFYMNVDTLPQGSMGVDMSGTMDVGTVVKAESVENLTIRNNRVLRADPKVSITLTAGQTGLLTGDKLMLKAEASGVQCKGTRDNMYEFTACKNVVLENNTYDDGMKNYAVYTGMSESNIKNLDKDIQVVEGEDVYPASAPVSNIKYRSSNPEVLTIDANGRMTGKKAGRASVVAYYEWNGTEILSNSLDIEVRDTVATEDTVTIKGGENVYLTEKDSSYSFAAEVPSGKPITWSVEDFLTGGVTEAAEIDENGVLTAKKNGIVWVRASAGFSSDKRAVVVSLPNLDDINLQLSIKRPDAENYTLTKEKITVDMQKGDLYNSDNSVKNLFLYQIPADIAKDDMRAVIKAENMPIRESGQWDTVSFILYKDDDNYITVGKKSHYDGIVTVTEAGGSAAETGGRESENTVTTAYLGFYKKGNSVSVDFKTEDGQWQHLRDITADMLGGSYQIGFTAWESNDRQKTASFSELRVGPGSTSYEDLCAQTPVSFTAEENHAPEGTDAAWDKASYRVGDQAAVSYIYMDAERDPEGKTLYCFTYENGWTEVTDEPAMTLTRRGEVMCRIYPVDSKGRPGEAIESKWAAIRDASALQAAVSEAEKKDLSPYTEESVKAYQAALKEAKAVLENLDASQEKIDGAVSALRAAGGQLKIKPAEQPVQPIVKKVPAVGTVIEVGGIRYQVTRSHAQKGTAAAVKLVGKKSAKIVIRDTVQKDGYTFKVTAIRPGAFQKNKKVKSLTVGSNITQIGKNAFYKCGKLKTITFKGKKAPKIVKGAFKGITVKSKIYVPKKMTASQLKVLKKRMKAAGAGSKTVYKKK